MGKYKPAGHDSMMIKIINKIRVERDATPS